MYKKIKKMKVLLTAIILFLGVGTQAQNDVMFELLRINTLLDKNEYINFNIAYYYEEDDSSGVSYDTLAGESSVYMGRSYMRLDGMKRVNNEYYNALVDTINKEIYVTKPEPLTKQYMKANFTDPAFYNNYVDSASVTDSSSFKIINFFFKPTAPFNAYKIVYSTTTLQPAYIYYSLKKDDGLDGSPPLPGPGGGGGGGTPAIRLKIVFSSFNLNANNPELFVTDKWFTRQNGVLTLQPAYSDYTIVDLTEGGG
jgi:hypothetical protein